MNEIRKRVGDAAGVGAVGVLVLMVVAAAIGAGVMWLTHRGATPAAEAESEEKPALPHGILEIPEAAQRNASMQVAVVQTKTLPATIEATGVVAPDEARIAHVRPLARGVISRVLVTLGARVSRGQVLATFDNIELGEVISSYRSEIAALNQARTDLEVRRRAVERAEELIKLEAIAQQAVEQRRAEFRNAEAAVASQQSKVARFEEQLHRFGLTEQEVTEVRDEKADHREASHASIRAPFAGVVTKMEAATGESSEPTDELFTVTDLSTVWVLANVYEKDIAKVRPNTDVMVHVDSYPDRVFTGRVGYISDLIDPQTRTAKVRCVVANSDAALKLDMFARVQVPTPAQHDAITIPAAAIQTINGQPVVFVRQSPTRFERRGVTVGNAADDVVEITAGLKAGETIVTAGSFYLKTALQRDLIGED